MESVGRGTYKMASLANLCNHCLEKQQLDGGMRSFLGWN